ncbi:hypothetical protein HanOQP8_Chr08g0293951 [Helianthus annuus]|nr:hypothetical protein HanLR1_Chr08g0286441 [Helianthus annuus]KAJ0723083.1 hypothetical protein HanOQP8_Chr08g0293951 [Helianthus annuus]
MGTIAAWHAVPGEAGLACRLRTSPAYVSLCCSLVGCIYCFYICLRLVFDCWFSNLGFLDLVVTDDDEVILIWELLVPIVISFQLTL